MSTITPLPQSTKFHHILPNTKYTKGKTGTRSINDLIKTVNNLKKESDQYKNTTDTKNLEQEKFLVLLGGITSLRASIEECKSKASKLSGKLEKSKSKDADSTKKLKLDQITNDLNGQLEAVSKKNIDMHIDALVRLRKAAGEKKNAAAVQNLELKQIREAQDLYKEFVELAKREAAGEKPVMLRASLEKTEHPGVETLDLLTGRQRKSGKISSRCLYTLSIMGQGPGAGVHDKHTGANIAGLFNALSALDSAEAEKGPAASQSSRL